MKEVMNKSNTCRLFQNSSTPRYGILVLNLGNRTFFFIGFHFLLHNDRHLPLSHQVLHQDRR
jgi:hypothetical protein